MRRLIFFLLILFSSTTTFSQSLAEQKIMERYQKFHNNNEPDSMKSICNSKMYDSYIWSRNFENSEQYPLVKYQYRGRDDEGLACYILYFDRDSLTKKERLMMKFSTDENGLINKYQFVIAGKPNSTTNTTFTQLELYTTKKFFVFDNPKLGQIKSDVFDNPDLISLLDNSKDMIYLYNTNKKDFVDSYSVGLLHLQYLFNYELLDSNNLLIALNPTYRADLHDSVICIIDREKSIKNVFSFENTLAPLYNADSPKSYRDREWWYAKQLGFPLKLNKADSSIIGVIVPFENLNCTTVTSKDKSCVYQLYSQPNKPAKQLNFKTPECSPHFPNWENEKGFSISVYGDYGKDNVPVIGYRHSDQLYMDNKVVKPKLQLYKSITDQEKITYITIKYDKYRSCYWWLLEIHYLNNDKEKINLNYGVNYLVQLNEKLEILSEGFMPYGCFSAIPTKDGLMVYNARISDSLGKSYYAIMKPINKNSSKQLVSTELKKPIEQFNANNTLFAKMIYENSKSSKNLLLSLDGMPPGYAKIILDKLKENPNIFNSMGMHIFTHNEHSVPEELRNMVHIYKYSELKKYIGNFTWPTIMEISKQDFSKQTKEEYPSNKAKQLIKLLERNGE